MKKELVRVRPKFGTGIMLAKIFKVTPEYVSLCCSGKKNTLLARKIRKAAFNHGGDPIYQEFANN